jgi:uncharacterized protein YcfJ
MAGLLNTGTDYQRTALSGMVRESAQEAERNKTNADVEAQKSNAEKANTSTLTATGAMAGAYAGATYGFMGGGPAGAVAGAAIGFLFSKLF